jgi:hypothetical protein
LSPANQLVLTSPVPPPPQESLALALGYPLTLPLQYPDPTSPTHRLRIAAHTCIERKHVLRRELGASEEEVVVLSCLCVEVSRMWQEVAILRLSLACSIGESAHLLHSSVISTCPIPLASSSVSSQAVGARSDRTSARAAFALAERPARRCCMSLSRAERSLLSEIFRAVEDPVERLALTSWQRGRPSGGFGRCP